MSENSGPAPPENANLVNNGVVGADMAEPDASKEESTCGGDGM